LRRSRRQDRRDVHAPRVFLLIVAVVLIFWLAFMLSTALMSVGLEFPVLAIDDAGAATLACGAGSCSSTNPQDFDFVPAAGSWAVVGTRSTAQNGDALVCAYRDAARTQLLGCSNLAGLDNVEFVAMDFHHTPSATRWARAERVSGTGELCTTFDCATTTLTPGFVPFTGSWAGTQVVRAFNVVLSGNVSYRIGLVETSGTVDFGIALFNSSGQVNYGAGRTLAAAQADVHGNGLGEGLFYRPAVSDTFGLVVWSNNAGATANYRIDVRQETEILPNTSVTTGGGAQADRFFVPPSPQGWNVLALRPIGSAGTPTDADLRLFDGFDHATLLKGSNAEPGVVDFLVGNYANVPEDTACVLTISFGPLGTYELSLLSNPPALAAGTNEPFSLPAVGGGRRVSLVAGTEYQFVFDPDDGTTGDICLGLYGPKVGKPLFTYGTRADSIAGSDAFGAAPGGWFGDNGTETFLFTPALSGEFLLYAYRKSGASVLGTLRYFPTSLVGVEPGAGEIFLGPATPSPALAGQPVRLRFDLPRAAAAQLVLFDARGRLVRRLAAGAFEAGPHQAVWDGRLESGATAPAGVYLARLDVSGAVRSRRVLWLP
jgi:hypothetical protein